MRIGSRCVYFGKLVTVIIVDGGQALIQKQSGQQTKWVERSLLKEDENHK